MGNWTAITLLYKPGADLQSAVSGSRRLWGLGSACGGVRGSIGAACAVPGVFWRAGGLLAPHESEIRGLMKEDCALQQCRESNSRIRGLLARPSSPAPCSPSPPLAALAACRVPLLASHLPLHGSPAHADTALSPKPCPFCMRGSRQREGRKRRCGLTWRKQKVCWHTLRPGAQAQQQGERSSSSKERGMRKRVRARRPL